MSLEKQLKNLPYRHLSGNKEIFLLTGEIEGE